MDLLRQLKEIQVEHIRAATSFSMVLQELEGDLKRMKEKNVPQEYIDKRDNQIEELVKFFNDTDTILQFYKMATINLQMEVKLTESLLYSTASNREQLIDALMNFKFQRNAKTAESKG
jgi:hypothetical protein